MALRFIGINPSTPNDGSPTVWVDDPDGSIVIQGWKITDKKTMADLKETGPIPDHETVVRIPAGMAPLLRDAAGDGGTGVV